MTNQDSKVYYTFVDSNFQDAHFALLQYAFETMGAGLYSSFEEALAGCYSLHSKDEIDNQKNYTIYIVRFKVTDATVLLKVFSQFLVGGKRSASEDFKIPIEVLNFIDIKK